MIKASVNRIDHYLTYEHNHRQRAILLSVGIGALVGMFSEEVLNWPFQAAALACCITVAAIQIKMALSYAPARVRDEPNHLFPDRRTLAKFAVSTPALLVATLGGPHLEASIVDKRLGRLLAEGRPSSSEADQIIGQAMAASIPASPSVLDALAKQLRVARAQTNGPEQEERLRLLIFRLNLYRLFSWADLKLKVLVLTKANLWFPKGRYLITKALPIPPGYASGEGPGESILVGSLPKDGVLLDFSLDGRDAIFADMGFDAPLEKGDAKYPVLSTVRGGGRVAFIDAIVENFSQDLSRIIWCNVTFLDCTIRYKGGPLHLFDVRFVNCTFDFASGHPQRVLRVLREAAGQPIHFDEG